MKEREKAGLRAGRALDAAERRPSMRCSSSLQIENEVVTPQAGAFADSGKLRRLEVREAERRQFAPLRGEASQGVDDADEPVAQEAQALAHQNQIGIVRDISSWWRRDG